MELISNIKRFTYKGFFVALFYSLLLWFSVFLYGMLYYLYIPAIAHVHPVYLHYAASCINRICPFPSANVSLVKKGQYELLTRGQSYAVEVTLDMPESDVNRRQGMFMIQLSMLSQNGEKLQSSTRPAVLRYKSPLFKVIYTVFFAPGLLAGTFEEKQSLIISLFEEYEEDPYRPTHFVHIEIQARAAEIYASQLRIHAQFTGLRYFMYYWPLISTIIGVGINFFFLSIGILFTWIRYTVNNSVPNISGSARQLHMKKMSFENESKISKELQKSHSVKGVIHEPPEGIKLISPHQSIKQVGHPVASASAPQLEPQLYGSQCEDIAHPTDKSDWVHLKENISEEAELVSSLRKRRL